MFDSGIASEIIIFAAGFICASLISLILIMILMSKSELTNNANDTTNKNNTTKLPKTFFGRTPMVDNHKAAAHRTPSMVKTIRDHLYKGEEPNEQ